MQIMNKLTRINTKMSIAKRSVTLSIRDIFHRSVGEHARLHFDRMQVKCKLLSGAFDVKWLQAHAQAKT